MPALRPAGPWRFEAAVTITECNEQSVTNWLQFAQIAESALEERQVKAQCHVEEGVWASGAC
jgi:hypothetical protein